MDLLSILKKITLTFLLLLLTTQVFALNYYWVGGSGSWSDFASHWATTSGGSSFHIQVPTSNDDVFFDANSFTAPGQTVTIDQTIVYCHDMSWSGVTNTPTLAGASSMKIDIFGSLVYSSAMNLTFSGSTNFSANSGGNTITTSGLNIPADWYFDGLGGSWTLQDNLTFDSGEGIYYFYSGTLNTNGHTVTLSRLWTSGTNTKQLNLGSSTINLVGSFASWYTTSSSFTVIPGTSTINIIGSGTFNFYGGGKNYNTVNFQAPVSNVAQDNNFNNLIFTPGTTVIFESGDVQTVTGSVTITGNCTNQISLQSSDVGISATLSKPSGTVNGDYLSLRDINATGGASFNANNAVDGGGNSGWIITPKVSQNFFWIGNNGNWSNTSNWSFSSGGPSAGCLPTSVDDVFFDANSFNGGGQAVTIDIPNATCRDMNWTGATNLPDLAGSGSNELFIAGSLTLIPAMTCSNTADVTFTSTAAGETITTAGNTINSDFYFNGLGGVWSLQDNLTFTSGAGIYYFYAGHLNTNGQTVTLSRFWTSGASTKILSLGSSTINLVGTVASWYTTSASFTVNPGTSLINIIGEGTFNFYGGGKTYHNVHFQANTTNVRYDNSYNDLILTAGKLTILESGDVQTVNGNLIAVGNCNSDITIKSSDAGLQSTISKPGGMVTGNYLSLTDIAAAGGAMFNAVNSIDGGGNSGWIIAPRTSQDFYWIGNNGNWGDVNNWSHSSGGPVAGCLPSSIDDVYFDGNSFNAGGQSATIDISPANCRSMSWIGATNNPTLAGNASADLFIYGSLRLIPNMSYTSVSDVTFSSTSTGNTITTAGNTITSDFYFDGLGGEWILQDDLIFQSGEGIYTFYAGELNTNGHTMTLSRLWTSGAATKQLTLGSSTVNLIGSVASWYTTASSFTVSPGTSRINIIGSGPFNFYGGGKSYHNVYFQALTTNVRYDNSYNNLNFTPGTTVNLRSGDTQFVNGFLTAIGSPGFPIEIQSSSPGTAGIISSPNDVCAEYLLISDNTATGGGIFTANNSTDIINNSGWIFNNPCTPLPIEIIEFNVNRVNQHDVNLNWSTATEINNDYFTIERSSDAKNWNTIKTIEGAGNSMHQIDYRAKDFNPGNDITYYRLKQTDFNGEYSYSEIRSVDNFDSSNLLVYPNPATNTIAVVSEGKLKKLVIQDLYGKQIDAPQIFNDQNTTIDISNLASGTYLLITDYGVKHFVKL